MRNTLIATLALSMGTFSIAGQAAAPLLIEESLAREEEGRIITSPIAGIENKFWFDYRGDINEAQKELSSDLNRASDIEDIRDAWEEYTFELAGERRSYVKEMAERGYRMGTVTIG